MNFNFKIVNNNIIKILIINNSCKNIPMKKQKIIIKIKILIMKLNFLIKEMLILQKILIIKILITK